jgi:hypothetical protein
LISLALHLFRTQNLSNGFVNNLNATLLYFHYQIVYQIMIRLKPFSENQELKKGGNSKRASHLIYIYAIYNQKMVAMVTVRGFNNLEQMAKISVQLSEETEHQIELSTSVGACADYYS